MVKDLRNSRMMLDCWQTWWARKLGEYRRSRNDYNMITYSSIWGESFHVIFNTLVIMLDDLVEIQNILASCDRPSSYRRRQRGQRVPFLIRWFYPGFEFRAEGSRYEIVNTSVFLVSGSGIPQGCSISRRRALWCTAIREEVDDLLFKVARGQEDLESLSTQAFDEWITKTTRIHAPLLLKETLTVKRAVDILSDSLRSSSSRRTLTGIGLVRDRKALQNCSNIINRPTPLAHTSVVVPITAEVQNGCRISHQALLAEIDLDFNLKFNPISDIHIADAVYGNDRVSLEESMSKSPIDTTFESVLRRVQMALTICISVFDLYHSGTLSPDLSIAHIYSYNHVLFSRDEQSQLLYQEQTYVAASSRHSPTPELTPFDHMRKIVRSDLKALTDDNLFHRLGIVLFEIGHGKRYRYVRSLPDVPRTALGYQPDSAAIQMIDESIESIRLGKQYSMIVRQCLSGGLGTNVLEASGTSSAKKVIGGLRNYEKQLEASVG